MQKEIRVVDYIRNMTNALAEYCYDDKENSILHVVIYTQALIFFKTFGLETSTNIITAFDKPEGEYSEEYYKALFLLYSNMTNENATAFIGALKGYVANENGKEEVS